MERLIKILKAAVIAGVAAACCSTGALAQPKLILVSNAADITADGNSAVGVILSERTWGQPYLFMRGAANVKVGGDVPSIDGRILLTNDKAFVSGALYNGFSGAQNPAFGYYSSNVVCCNGSTCTVVASPQACSGTIVGNTGTCTAGLCPQPASPPAVGACCDPISSACTVTTKSACASPNYWMSNFDTCGSNPCKHGHFVQHRLNTSTGVWQNLGAFPNVGGQGASKCDGNVNTIYGISTDGMFTVGSGQYGTYNTTSCNTRGFVWSQADGVVRVLPPLGTGCQIFSQAEYITTDGLIVSGTDSNQGPQDPAGLSAPIASQCNNRTVAVWERASATSEFLPAGRTILDRFGGGGLGAACMTPSGSVYANLSADAATYDVMGACCEADNTCVTVNRATCDSLAGGVWRYTTTCSATPCPYAVPSEDATGSLVRYRKISNVWTREFIGKVVPPDGLPPVGAMFPRSVSDDGNTVIGTAVFGGTSTFFNPSASFIWKASANGGVPMIFSDYLTALNGGNPFPSAGAVSVSGSLSADGNAMLVSYSPPAPAQCGTNGGLQDLSRPAILYLNGAAIGCEPVKIVDGPYDRLQAEYTIFGIVGNIFFTGSQPVNAQWQKEIPSGSGNWVNLTDSCGVFNADQSWTFEGTTGYQLRVNMLANAADRDGRYRVVLSNACGTATSRVAELGVVSGACCYVSGTQTLCSIEQKTRCVGSTAISYFLGGTYLGDNTTCGPTTCSTVSGACCTGAGGPSSTCTIAIQPYCVLATSSGGLGGVYAGNGSTCQPSACATVSGACCYSQSSTSNVICTLETSGYCTKTAANGGVGGAFIGVSTTCSPTACAAVAGACCFAPDTTTSVICTVQTSARCSGELRNGGLQGLFVGEGSVCSPSDLCSIAIGACCYTPVGATEAVCTMQLQNVCTYRVNGQFLNNNSSNPLIIGLGGVYRGDGTTCGPTSCTNAIGACCYTPTTPGACPVCITAPQTRCTDPTSLGGLAGTWAGATTTCNPTPACSLQTGACCVFGECVLTCEASCTINSGTFSLGGVCSPDPCSTTQRVCCRGTTCVTVASSSCVPINGVGVFSSTQTACNSGSNTGPCCYADFNKDNTRNIDDIFIYLNAWFSPATNAYCDVGGDGTAQANIDDLFIFLNVWFAGGCG